MTPYEHGFLSKCAECGVPRHVAEGMMKQSASWERALLRYASRAKLPKKETYRLWLSVLSRSNPEIAAKLPKTLQHVSAEKQLGPWTNGRSRKIYSKLMGEVNAARNNVFNYIEPRAVPFSQVANNRPGDFIFKGSGMTSLSTALDDSSSKQLWWSHNPAASMGYTPNNNVGTFHILPISGDFQKKVHSRFTPHIASGKEADIAKAIADKTQRAGRSAAGAAYDYEFVSNADDIPNFLGKTEKWFTFPSRNSVYGKSGGIPVYHGFDVDPNDRYFSQRLFFNDNETKKGLISLLTNNGFAHKTVDLSPLPSFSSRHKGMFPSTSVYDVMSGPKIVRSSLPPNNVRRFN